LIVAHQPTLVQIADRVCAMKDGRIADEFPSHAFCFEPSSTQAGMMEGWGAANAAPPTIR
jgi:ABC-type lipoprotein export system ATPase subunit